MSYEHKEYITQFFDSVHQEEELKELDKVYAKAQAFDDIMKLLNKHTTFIEDYHTNWECFGEEMIDLGLTEL